MKIILLERDRFTLKVVSEIVKSSLGPRGIDKMLVNNLGDITITNDGATILREGDVQHPAAKMMVEVAKSVDNEVGDGTTSSVVLAGALIEKAEELINKEVHPAVIVDGYTAASEQALKILQKIAVNVDADDKKLLAKVAMTSLGTKLLSQLLDKIDEYVEDPIRRHPQTRKPYEPVKGPLPPPPPCRISKIIVEALLRIREKIPDTRGYRVENVCYLVRGFKNS